MIGKKQTDFIIKQYSKRMKSSAGLSSFFFSDLFFFQNVHVEAVTFRERNLALLVSNDEDVSGTGGEGFSIGISNMGNIERTKMAFNVHEGSDSTDVISTSDVAQFSRFIFVPSVDLSLFKIVFDCISFIDFGMRESDGPRVMGDNIRNFVWSHSFCFNFAKLEFGFRVFDREEGESSFNIIKHAVVLVGLDNRDDIHDSNWELSIAPNFIVDFESSFFVHGYGGHFTSIQCEIKTLPTLQKPHLMMMERGRHSLSLWGPWLGLVAQIPPIFDKSHDRGVLILFKCFLGPLAMSGCFNQYLNIIQFIFLNFILSSFSLHTPLKRGSCPYKNFAAINQIYKLLNFSRILFNKYMYRNTLDQGSRFYNPLKQTLEKSRVQDPAISLAKSRVYDQMGVPSRISKRMRSLSPEEADEITRETIVTEDKELVATNNLWRVRGKEFTAVNINIKEGKPVPPQIVLSKFGNTRNGFITSETIYEMRPRHSHRSLNTSFRPGASLRFQSPPPPSGFSYFPQPYNSPPSIYSSNKPIEKPIPRVASPVRVKQNSMILKSSNQNLQNDLKLEERPPLSNSSPSLQLDRISTQFKPAKKSAYKYNLFSSLDEAVNTGCGSCGGNQLIASKPNSYWT